MPPSVPGPAPELLLVVALLALVVACAWPRTFLLVALASLAVRPEALFGGAALSHAWGIQHTLLIVALAGCAWRYGLLREVNWPVLAVATTFALSFLLGDLHPDLTAWGMLGALGVLCLPWLFAQVALPPGSRRTCALLLALLPSMNVLVALLLQSPDLVYGVFDYKDFEGSYRLVGPAGDPGFLAVMAFAGFAVALHEATRPGRPWAPMLATVNLGIVILTVTRVGILASLLLLLTYAALSPVLRERLLRRRGLLMLGAGVVLALFAATLPSMLQRVTSSQSWILSGGRDLIWPFYWEQFLATPIFGRGFGAGFLDLGTRVPRKSPHNEYLHILVIGGVAGLILCLTAIAAWFGQLLARVSPNDREFVLALLPAVAMFAVTEDVLTLSGALVLWVYLGTLLTLPAVAPPGWRGESTLADRDAVSHAALGASLAAGTHDRWPGLQGSYAVAQEAGTARSSPTVRRHQAITAFAEVSAGLTAPEAGVRGPDRPIGLRTMGRSLLEEHQTDADDGGSEPAGAPLASPPDGRLSARSYYWVKTFPLVRRLFRAVAGDGFITLLLLALLASLAISPSDIVGEEAAGAWERSWHKLLLLLAIGLGALRFGVRLLPNWVLVALLVLLPVNFILAERLEGLSAAMTIKTFFGLALPWIFVHVVFDRRARPYYCMALAFAPLLSSLVGLAIDPDWDFNRFAGTTNAAFLGASAFFGFAIAAHEYGQKRQATFVVLAFASLVIVVFSGSRMAWLSSLIFSTTLYLRSFNLREAMRQSYLILVPGLVCVAIMFALYVPFMETRLVGLSGRDTIWNFFWYEIGRSAWFGRGLGASEILRLQYEVSATHSEYIRMLVDAGVLGLLLFLVGVAVWFRQLLGLLPAEHRAFVWAMIPCLAFYAATDNILAMMQALAVFVYFGMLIDDPVGPGDGPLVGPGQRARL